MKKIILIATVFLMSCEQRKQPSYIDGTTQNAYSNDIYYFKDSRTGVCFAERGKYDSYTMTCVPCDSIKQFLNKK